MIGRIPAEVFPPGEFIREELEARGWTQNDLAEILGSYPRFVSEIITGKRAITPDTAKKLGAAFGTDPQLWMNLESSYRLWRVKTREETVAQRARLFEKAPLREMARRKWIEYSENVEVLERRLLDFFNIKTLEDEPEFVPFAARTSLPYQTVTPAQRAWLFRARHLAPAVTVAKFTHSRFAKGLERLRMLLHHEEEARHIPRILAESGIRFLIVEPLPQTRIDGVCFWLDENSPVVVLSLRYDRIDWFWHTVMHELGHVEKRHGLTEPVHLDTDLVGERAERRDQKPEAEQQADMFAAESLIPRDQLEDFIARVKPLYSKQRIAGFATRMKVHPGIVVGQLQFRGEIAYAHSRETLAKVRPIVTQSALTDGWGHIPSGL